MIWSINFRCVVNNFKGYFAKDDISIPPGWFHFALVFHGPEHGQGITVYKTGTPATSTPLRGDNHIHTRNSSGTVVIGRLREDRYKLRYPHG